MSAAPYVDESVEAFARVCAALDDPFADRAGVLFAASLGEATFAHLVDVWSARVAGAGAATTELAERFAVAYRAARSGRGAALKIEPAYLLVPAADASRAEPVITEATSPLRVAPIETPSFMKRPPSAHASAIAVAGEGQTMDVPASQALRPSIPFSASGPSMAAAAAPRVAQGPRPHSAVPTETAPIDISKIGGAAVPFNSRDSGTPQAVGAFSPEPKNPPAGPSFGQTEEIDLRALLKQLRPLPFDESALQPRTAALPAVPPRSPAPSPASQGRLMYFDPQTGRPLAQPRWEDVPEPDKKA